MKFFIDSASPEAIKTAMAHGFVSGVTTNPSLVAKEPPHPQGYYGQLRDIIRVIGPDVPISVQPPIAELAVAPRETIGKIKGILQSRQIIIKIAMSWENLPLIRIAAMIAPVNVTCVFTAAQAVAAASTGARFVSFFWCRINDGENPPSANSMVQDVRNLFDRYNIRAEIIAGSIRTKTDAVEALKCGAHIVTAKLSVLEDMSNSTESNNSASGFEDALAVWEKACEELPPLEEGNVG